MPRAAWGIGGQDQEIRRNIRGSGEYQEINGALCTIPLARSTLLAGGLGLGLLDLVGVDPVEEVLPALRVLQVLDTDVDPLGQDLAAHPLVHHHTHGALGHVKDTTGLAVEGLVGHSLLEGSAS